MGEEQKKETSDKRRFNQFEVCSRTVHRGTLLCVMQFGRERDGPSGATLGLNNITETPKRKQSNIHKKSCSVFIKANEAFEL